MSIAKSNRISAFLFIIFLSSVAHSQVNIQEVLAPGSLDGPIGIVNAADGSNRLFVIEQKGFIRIVKNGVLLPTAFLNVTAITLNPGENPGERGLLNVAFPPNYETSGKFYIYYTDLNGDVTVARYTVSGNADVANPTGEVILSVPHPGHANHNGGSMAFGPDGYLYLGLGDGGGAGDTDGNAQNLNILLGKILRLDVSGMTGYSIPPSNPFVGKNGADEIWAYGMRNPWRFSFDRQTGDLFIGDVGQGCWEEVDFQPSNSTGGENYGWRVWEGSRCYTGGSCNSSCSPPPNNEPPIFSYSHSDTSNANSIVITGGYRYRGSDVAALSGKYVFADYSSGQICAITETTPGDWTNLINNLTEIQLFDTNYFVSSFGEDESGELYFADAGEGALYKLVGPGAPNFSDDFQDGTFNWNSLKGTWLETGGNLNNMSAKKSEVLTPGIFGGCAICTINTDVHVDVESAKVSILGWYANKSNYVELRMMPEKNKWVLKQVSNGTAVAKEKGLAPNLSAGVSYQVQISYDGSQFQVTIDGNLLITMPDGAPAFGIAGFRVKGSSPVSANITGIDVN